MGSTETWLCNVKVTIHIENAGSRCLKRGLEPMDEEVTLEAAVRRFGGEYVKRQILECLDAAVARVVSQRNERSTTTRGSMDKIAGTFNIQDYFFSEEDESKSQPDLELKIILRTPF